MALETGTYVSDLVTTNPTAGDPVSQADDHLRLIKSVLKTTFPNASGPVLAFTAGTLQASTSGTTLDFTGIPATAKRVTVLFNGVSTNNISALIVQMGTAGGVEATGYSGTYASVTSTVQPATTIATGIVVNNTGAASGVITGMIRIELMSAASNTWIYMGQSTASQPATNILWTSGVKSTAAALDRIRITTVEGHTFDAGSVNISYE